MLKVLFNVPSLYLLRYQTWNIFRIGSWWLPNFDSNSNESYSRYSHFLLIVNYGTITLYSVTFQKTLFKLKRSKSESYNTTFLLYFYNGIITLPTFTISMIKGYVYEYFLIVSTGFSSQYIPQISISNIDITFNVKVNSPYSIPWIINGFFFTLSKNNKQEYNTNYFFH